MFAPVANESDAVLIAAGAALGGRPAAVYMEGSGVYVASYNLLVVGKRLGVPMLLMVAYYGSTMDRRNSFLYAYPGIHLAPLLESLAIQYEILERQGVFPDDCSDCYVSKPVALPSVIWRHPPPFILLLSRSRALSRL